MRRCGRLNSKMYRSQAKILLPGMTICLWLAFSVIFVASSAAQTAQPPISYPALPSETPAKLEPVTSSFDYSRREVMIPMRDGVKLHTVILVPKGAQGAPILLTRTPYNANGLTSHAESSHLGPILQGYDNATDVIVEGGYIRVVQDVRGKYGSEGDYVMNRPLHGPQNPTPVDHATDTYDTIDWLVKNVPESNGKVGILGISYDGFLPLMALVNPHPALKVAVPMNPMVDGWMGDDWFHNGAFRQTEHGLHLRAGGHARTSRRQVVDAATTTTTTCTCRRVSAGELGARTVWSRSASGGRSWSTPATTPSGSDQAVDRVLAAEPLKVPVMLVDSLWDQEDIYGAMAVYKAIKPKDTSNDKVFLVHGPVVSRPGDRRRQHAWPLEIRQRYRRSTSAARSCGRFWISI